MTSRASSSYPEPVGLLHGYRVIESSLLLNGATTTMMLADLGADVIKVENPALGDYIRIPETEYLHLQVNKGKRSLAVDLRTDAGREVFGRLLATADVFVTNAVADRNRRLGLAYDQLRALKPDLVYCQNTGFGATGPYASIPTHGQMMDSLAGARPVALGADGLTHARGGATWPSLQVGGEATATGAVYAAFHVAAALAHRERTGEGCYIDVSAACAVVASAWSAFSAQLNEPELVDAMEADRDGVARYQWYETADGRFVIFCPEERRFWDRFCELVGRPDLRDRVHGIELRKEIQAVLRTRTRDEWLSVALEHDLPLGPVHDGAAAVAADPQIAARQILIRSSRPDGRPFTYVGQPALVDGKAAEPGAAAPTPGQHTDEVLRELGYDAGAIAALADAGVTTAATVDDSYIAEGVHGGIRT
jgi:crotonobetainyl-CoA:carnitine CoA-transferase CaiB-like acyl-CoA transferase